MELTEQEVYELLEQAVSAAGGRSKFAETHGLSIQYVHDVLNRRRGLGPAICKALRIEKVVRYRRIDKPDAPSA